MTIVFKVSDNIKPKIIKYYENLKRDKTPPYAIFQAEEAGTIVTMYESGKIMFQGISADIDARIWIEMEKNYNDRDIDINTGKEKSKTKSDTPKKNYNKYNIILSIMRRQVYKKVIEIAPDLKRQIAMEMGCTVDTVYNALNLSNPTTGAQPDRIRRRAMELGGKENRKIRWINY